MPSIEEEIGIIEEPDEETKRRWINNTIFGKYVQL